MLIFFFLTNFSAPTTVSQPTTSPTPSIISPTTPNEPNTTDQPPPLTTSSPPTPSLTTPTTPDTPVTTPTTDPSHTPPPARARCFPNQTGSDIIIMCVPETGSPSIALILYRINEGLQNVGKINLESLSNQDIIESG